MMDAPMIDVIASLPLAAEMREALVGRKGKRGLLLECVTALETGEISDMPSIVANAGELYLDALMWSNSAAESLFESTAPGKQAKSTPPPVSQPAPAPVAAIITPSPEPAPAAQGGTSDERGWFARVLGRCFGWIGRRRLGQESA